MKTTDSIQQSAKTAGIAYLLIIVSSILALILGPYQLMVEGDHPATISNIDSNQLLFRIGAAYDLLMYIGVIILSVALYNVLKTVNKSVSQTALYSRIGEAFIGSLTVVCSIAILILVNSDHSSEEVLTITAIIFEIKHALLNIVFAFLGFGSILFCYLFYKARYIPRFLAALGMLAFALVLGESLAVLLFSVKSTVVTGAPAILFEITIGIWLMVRGVNTSFFSTNK